MAKRSGRRASRATRGAQNAAEQQPEGPVRRWWNGVTKAILGAGALASAVAAIVSLWPDPDAADVAKFAAVRVTPEVPFSEYRQRLVTAHASGDDSVGRRPWGASAYRPVVHRKLRPTTRRCPLRRSRLHRTTRHRRVGHLWRPARNRHQVPLRSK
jgi:hypothetical protein